MQVKCAHGSSKSTKLNLDNILVKKGKYAHPFLLCSEHGNSIIQQSISIIECSAYYHLMVAASQTAIK